MSKMDCCRFRCMIIDTEYVQFQSCVLVNPMHEYMCVEDGESEGDLSRFG